jgi:hypothetical protein
MKRLRPISFNPKIARQELESFRCLLSDKTELSRERDLLDFFRAHKQLIALIGFFHEIPINIDRISWEYDLFGDFKSDFVAGDYERHKYCFAEFQDATKDSIFKKGKRSNSEWADSFEEGFSQIVDWAYKLADNEKLDEFENRFGARTIDAQYVIIVGRSAFLDPSESKRFQWRRRRIALESRPIRCLTYDELFADMNIFLNILPTAAQADARLTMEGKQELAELGFENSFAHP